MARISLQKQEAETEKYLIELLLPTYKCLSMGMFQTSDLWCAAGFPDLLQCVVALLIVLHVCYTNPFLLVFEWFCVDRCMLLLTLYLLR